MARSDSNSRRIALYLKELVAYISLLFGSKWGQEAIKLSVLRKRKNELVSMSVADAVKELDMPKASPYKVQKTLYLAEVCYLGALASVGVFDKTLLDRPFAFAERGPVVSGNFKELVAQPTSRERCINFQAYCLQTAKNITEDLTDAQLGALVHIQGGTWSKMNDAGAKPGDVIPASEIVASYKNSLN